MYDQNAKLVAQGSTPINLRAIMIRLWRVAPLVPILNADILAYFRNGMTDPFVILWHECTPASLEPILDISSCVAMKSTVSISAAYSAVSDAAKVASAL